MFAEIKVRLAAWWAVKRVEARRIFKSQSTYVVTAGAALPQLWSSIPSRFMEGVYAVVPMLRTWDWLVYAVGFAFMFWKARNRPQGIDLPKT